MTLYPIAFVSNPGCPHQSELLASGAMGVFMQGTRAVNEPHKLVSAGATPAPAPFRFSTLPFLEGQTETAARSARIVRACSASLRGFGSTMHPSSRTIPRRLKRQLPRLFTGELCQHESRSVISPAALIRVSVVSPFVGSLTARSKWPATIPDGSRFTLGQRPAWTRNAWRQSPQLAAA